MTSAASRAGKGAALARRSDLVRGSLLVLYALATAAMVWWTFAWPLLIDDDPASRVLRHGALWTLFLYAAAVVGLLYERLTAKRDSGSATGNA